MIDSRLGNGLHNCSQAIKEEFQRITEIRDDRLPDTEWSRTVLDGGILEFGSGIYRVTETIELAHGGRDDMTTGLTIRGAGVCAKSRRVLPKGGPWQTPKNKFLATAILWDGPPDQPMIRYNGTGLDINGLSLWGHSVGGPTPSVSKVRASVGLQVSKSPTGGTGHFCIGHFSVDNCNIGIRFGESPTDGNCADVSYRHVYLYRCDTGIRGENDMTLNHIGQFLQASDCRVVLDFVRGGKVNFQTVMMEANCDCMLQTEMTGSGNESFTFGSVTMDASQPVMPCIVRQVETSPEASDRYLSVLIGQLHAPPGLRQRPRPTPVFDLQPRGRVRVLQGQWLLKTDVENVPGLTAEHIRN